MASCEGRRHRHYLVPLAALISREMKSEKIEKPTVRYGHAAQSRKGEDYFLFKTDCQRVPRNSSSTFSIFAIFDGHNGNAVAIFTRELLGAMPCGLGREEWLQALPRALVARFVKTDKEFQNRGMEIGGRRIIASDAIWDAVSSEMAAKSCRGLPAKLAAGQVVKEALRTRGLKDDTTCIVVDIIPPDNSEQPSTPPKKQSKLRALRKRCRSSAIKLSKKLSAVGIVEELFEEGSAMLAERLGNDEPRGRLASDLFVFAVCQVDLAPSEGISIHAGAIFSTSSKPWRGPFLCADCRNKKDAMEGKRPSGVKVA